jgi:D-serine deaminase-like pyridoxal phosphate-dependent protein
MRSAGRHPLPDVPVGTRVRILPHHACATAAQHREYHIIDSARAADGTPAVHATWARVSGW